MRSFANIRYEQYVFTALKCRRSTSWVNISILSHHLTVNSSGLLQTAFSDLATVTSLGFAPESLVPFHVLGENDMLSFLLHEHQEEN